MRRNHIVFLASVAVSAAVSPVCGADRAVDPTFLRRHLPSVAPAPSDLTTPTCRYKPVFGAGDTDSRHLRGIVRFGEMTLDARGKSAIVNYADEEQVYVVSRGGGIIVYGQQRVSFRAGDFMYLPPGIAHGAENPGSVSASIIVMGFRMPAGAPVTPPPSLLKANMDEVPKQVVGNHPPSTLYQLLMGDTESKRDRLAAARVLTSLFTMEFSAGGTNFPHHHETEEEIYLVLEGHGDMVAGGGMDGIEGRHPAKAGDAYFFRLNCTVGFYSGGREGAPKARILAVRSRFPFQKR